MITIERLGDTPVCVAHIMGELDSVNVPELREGIENEIAGGFTSFVFDLSEATYIDSSALGLLVWADHRLQPLHGRVTLAGAGSSVSRILELSGLMGFAPSLKASNSLEEALAGLVPCEMSTDPLWVESFTFPADVHEISAVRNRVTGLLVPLGMPEASVFDIKVAVGEALANAVRHGSPNGVSDIVEVRVAAYPDHVDVSVCDCGHGFNGEAPQHDDVYASSGRGVLFMRALMDVVEFSRGTRGGTLVRLAKRCSPAVSAQ